jgi:RND family efflux transporter MFP subunit
MPLREPLSRLSLQLLCLLLTLGAWSGPATSQDLEKRVFVDKVRIVQLSQKVEVLGQLVAKRQGEVAARINGPIESFSVQIGDRLEAGQIIAAIDNRRLKAQRDLEASRHGEAKAELATREEELRLSSLAFERQKKLKSSAAFNQARFEDARQAVAIDRAEVEEARARVLSAAADLQLAEIDLYNARVRAPYAGVVTARLAETGNYLQTGAAVVRMIADQDLEIEADIPFQQLEGLTASRAIGFTLEDGTRHQAFLRSIVPEENPLTRTRAVRFTPQFNSPRITLADGQSVTLELPVGEQRDALTVHKDAVIKRGTQNLVFVVGAEGAEPRMVQLGRAVGERFEVLDGLAAGEQAIIRGNERLLPGDKILVEEAS